MSAGAQTQGGGAARSRGGGEWLAPLLAAAATVAVTWGLLERPRQTAAALVLAAVVTALVVSRHTLPRVTVESVLRLCLFLLPMAALLGASAAVPGFGQLFAFRVLIVAAIVAGLVWALASRRLVLDAPRAPVLLFVAWFAWLTVTLLWAPDKVEGLRYLGLILLEITLMIATAAAGTSRRWLRGLMITLAIAYGLSLLVAAAEILVGWHLSSSVGSHGGKAHVATGFLYNPNDLATLIAIAWPFALLALLLAPRHGQRLLAAAALGLSLWVLLDSGSRASLIAIGIATLALPFLVVRRRWVRRRGLLVGATVALLALFAFLAFNPTDVPVLRQFRLVNLTEQTDYGTGSGSTRLALIRSGGEVGARYAFLGVGPGNAGLLVKQQPDAPEDVSALHNWWWEIFVNGGLPALVLYGMLYVALVTIALRVSRFARDPFLQRLAAAVFLAMLGYTIGCLGPSTVVTFAPMWILFGLALAVAIAARREVRDGDRIGEAT